MTGRAFIKPARRGLVVRDPLTGEALPAAGCDVPLTQHWRRQLAAGDVVTGKRPKRRRAKTPSE